MLTLKADGRQWETEGEGGRGIDRRPRCKLRQGCPWPAANHGMARHVAALAHCPSSHGNQAGMLGNKPLDRYLKVAPGSAAILAKYR
jgi:hypothetical protein